MGILIRGLKKGGLFYIEVIDSVVGGTFVGNVISEKYQESKKRGLSSRTRCHAWKTSWVDHSFKSFTRESGYSKKANEDERQVYQERTCTQIGKHGDMSAKAGNSM